MVLRFDQDDKVKQILATLGISARGSGAAQTPQLRFAPDDKIKQIPRYARDFGARLRRRANASTSLRSG
jgi:hypothetical protein